jgi:hypothetical protein
MMFDISISSKWKEPWSATKGRPTSRKIRSRNRKRRLNKPVNITLINDAYLDYSKYNWCEHHVAENCWNEGFKLRRHLEAVKKIKK